MTHLSHKREPKTSRCQSVAQLFFYMSTHWEKSVCANHPYLSTKKGNPNKTKLFHIYTCLAKGVNKQSKTKQNGTVRCYVSEECIPKKNKSLSYWKANKNNKSSYYYTKKIVVKWKQVRTKYLRFRQNTFDCVFQGRARTFFLLLCCRTQSLYHAKYYLAALKQSCCWDSYV